MSDESAFLAAISAAPGDDLPRLVYADWLDERGEAEKAEFVRLTCQRRTALHRLTDLRDELPGEWSHLLDPLPAPVEGAMFSQEFRERLRVGKYARWAENLTEAQLEAIIWMIGEFGYRAYHVLPLLTGLQAREGSGRAVVALESLYRVVGGDRPDWEASSQRVRDFLAKVRGHAEPAERPPAHSWPVEWLGRAVGWLAHPTLDEHGIRCSGVWWPGQAAAEFLAHIAAPPADGVRVTVGGVPGWVDSPPDDSRRMTFLLHVSPHNA